MSATLWMDDLHRFLTLPPMAALAVLLAPAVFAQGEADASAPTLQEALGLPDGMRIGRFETRAPTRGAGA